MRRLALIPILIVAACASPPPEPGLVPRLTLFDGPPDEVISSRRCGHLFIADVMIDGKGPFAMLLDTGTTAMIVTPDLDRELRADGRGGRFVKEMRIGTLVIGDLAYVPVDLGPIEDALGTTVDGILGMQVFRHVLVTYDYPAGEVRAHLEEFAASDPGVVSYEVGESGRPWLPFDLPPLKGRVLLDTGGSDVLTLSDEVEIPADAEPRPVGTRRLVDQRYTARAVRARGVAEVGPLRLDRPVVTIGKGTPRLGVPALSGFAITFDQRHERVRFVPSPLAPIPTPGLRGIGVGLGQEDGVWKIIDVYPDTPAARAGLRPGDRIAAVDGRPWDGLGCDRMTYVRDARDRVRLSVERDGRRFDVDVAIVDLVP